MELPVVKIRENPVALRNVNFESEQYLGLVDSIKQVGLMNPISVRQRVDTETQEEYWELVDGLHRFSACRDAGLTVIPVNVMDLADSEVLEAQVIANVHKIETKPADYSRQLQRILAANPTMTETELAGKLGKTAGWISQRLGLNKIDNKEIVDAINNGKIGLANAYALAKLPADEMPEFVARAMTEAPDVFIPAVQKRVKEIKEAKRKGKDTAPRIFSPVAHPQKLKDVKIELDSGSIRDILIKTTGIKKAGEGFKLACEWFLHLDPLSVEDQKAKWEANESKKNEAIKQRKAIKAEKKAADLKKKADDAANAAAKAKENVN
jgi:ParB/RepB/Spo0J family partition protein